MILKEGIYRSIIGRRLGSMGNYEFYLNADLREFVGEWVAIVDEKIVAHGKSAKDVYAKAKHISPGKVPFLSCVPKAAAMIF